MGKSYLLFNEYNFSEEDETCSVHNSVYSFVLGKVVMLNIDYYNTDLVINIDFSKLGLFLLKLVQSIAVFVRFIFRQFHQPQRENGSIFPDYCPRHRMGIQVPRHQNGFRY